MRICVSILLFILLLPHLCAAQNGQHSYYLSVNRSNGAPSDEVYDMCEDDNGFMWLATGSGLYRYDGFSFVAWKSEMQTSASGSCVRKDKYGRIWYENFDGFLYYTDGKILKPLQQKRSKAYMPYGITDKFLFVLQPDGVDVYDIKTLAKVRTVHLSLLRLEHACCANGAYYLAADGYVYKIDADLQLSSSRIDNETVLVNQLFATDDSLFVLPRLGVAGTIKVLDKQLNNVRNIYVASDGYLRGLEQIGTRKWVYSSSGCMVVGASGQIEKSLFKGKSISKVLLDKNGNYWFATTNEGIYIVPDLANTVYTYNNAKMRQVAVTGSGILAGTYTGELLRLTPEDGSISEVSKDVNGAEIYYLYADDHSIIYSATGHTMLTGAGSKQSKVATIAIKAVVPVDNKYYAVAASGMCLLLPMPNVTSDGASVWDQATVYIRLSEVYGALKLLDGVRARTIAYDSVSHTIYCATNSGIVAISVEGSRQVARNGMPVYAAEMVNYKGAVYVADTKGKLLRINRGGYIEDVHDFPFSGSVRLLKVSGDKLYYCSGKSLYEYGGDRVKLVEVLIDADEINDLAATDSSVWLATNSGLVSFATENRNPPVSPIHLYINSVMVNESEADSTQLNKLSFGENNITIGYSLVEFAAPIPSVISYRINEGNWVDLPSNMRTLHFRSLSPGKYAISFAVNGKETGRSVDFNISAPFWQQLWFYVFGVVVVLFVVLAIYSFRMKAGMKKEQQRQEKLLLEERLSRSMLSALRSQMNPHFFFNALNTVQAYIFTNEKSKAGDYLAKLSLLTRTILEMSEAETVMLNSETEALNLYLEMECTRFGDDFRYRIDVEKDLETAAIEIPSMIIQPFVENAVKHGLLHKEGEKRLNVSFATKDSKLIITIDDNGIGRARSEALNEIKNRRYKSYATRATAERVKLLNAGSPDRIAVTTIDKTGADGVALGTLVTIKIKLT
ncbi:MAG: histidine kinase [Taibaiella sp.]|nr:histidine kinase [Taibaiella sp.]